MEAVKQVPVFRKGQDILWRGNSVTLEDFPAVREFVDACLDPSTFSGDTADLTTDFQLLLDLVMDLDGEIPWFSEEEMKDALEAIPTRPTALPKPEIPFVLSPSVISKNRQRWSQFRKFMKVYEEYEKARANWNYDRMMKRVHPDLKLGPRPIPPEQAVSVSKHESLQYEGFCDYMDKLEPYQQRRSEIAEYKRSLPEFRRRHELHGRIQTLIGRYHFQKRSLERLRRRLENLLSGKTIHFEQLNWTILPGGGSLSALIEKYLENERRCHASVVLDASRVRQILTLNPTRALIGKHEFDGYIVFLFDGIPFAVLTCPRVGNALYLLRDNWETLAKLPKSRLLAEHASHVRRIIHGASGGWFNKLRDELWEWDKSKTPTTIF